VEKKVLRALLVQLDLVAHQVHPGQLVQLDHRVQRVLLVTLGQKESKAQLAPQAPQEILDLQAPQDPQDLRDKKAQLVMLVLKVLQVNTSIFSTENKVATCIVVCILCVILKRKTLFILSK
jgi:hypothetical protein